MRFFGPKEIKDHVRRILQENSRALQGALFLDFPAGNGVTSKEALRLGAKVQAVDLFPELFRESPDLVMKGDLSEPFPLPDEQFDFAICQEGIEHVGNQDHVFREFARVLKPGGRLLVTTPNYSSIKSRLSYLFTESEAFGRIMPPNEHDSIWLSNKSEPEQRIYFGHCFLTGFFRLKLFARLTGLEVRKVHNSKVNTTSLIWFPLLYPFIFLISLKTTRRFIRKTKQK